jgi:pullulanase-type alpha-1,6-glucosidase
MVNLRAALDALTVTDDGVDGPAIYVYGEGWNFGEVANNARGRNATQLNIGGTGIGVFNDRLRDAARGGGPFGPLPEQGFLTGLWLAPNDYEERAPADQQAKLLEYMDWIRIGLAGNLKLYALQDARGNTVTGEQIKYNGAPAGYTLDPQENIVYISAHDNETLFDAIQAKAPLSATIQDRVRMNQLGLSLVLSAQGVPFFHAGDDILRSKSLDRNSYNSGDWFNKLDFTYTSNNWAVGQPPSGDNADKWPILQPLLANADLRVTQADILATLAHFEEWAQIRRSSPLFRLQTAEQVQSAVSFLNTGPEQIPGLIVLNLSNPAGQSLDPNYDRLAVLFNARPEPVTFADSSYVGLALKLHPILAESQDAIVKESQFDPASGAFTVPARTAAVFVLPAGLVTAQPEPTAVAAATPTVAPTLAPQPTAVPQPTAIPAPPPAALPDLALPFILLMAGALVVIGLVARRRA